MRRLAEPYGADVPDTWDHIIGPEIARQHEEYRSRRPARHRAADPVADYYESVRKYAAPDSRLMRAIDDAQQVHARKSQVVGNDSGSAS